MFWIYAITLLGTLALTQDILKSAILGIKVQFSFVNKRQKSSP